MQTDMRNLPTDIVLDMLAFIGNPPAIADTICPHKKGPALAVGQRKGPAHLPRGRVVVTIQFPHFIPMLC